MASLIYNNCLWEQAKGNIDYDTDTFYAMLVTSSYAPNKDTDNRRDDVTNEVSGTGYTAGGTAATVAVSAIDTTNDRVEITLGAVSWPTSTLTARGAVYYKHRGGASSADELVAYIDFGADISSAGGTFSLSASTLRFQN
jgi:cation transport regulator ChaB